MLAGRGRFLTTPSRSVARPRSKRPSSSSTPATSATTFSGGVLPGFGDQRELELLVEAGFTPAEAIHIATENGAKFLGEESELGTIGVGKAADLVILNGNPAANISDVEKADTVFKDGVGYSPEKLIDSVRGLMGLR